MASFVDAHKKVGKSEGGYTNNPKDNGNWVDGQLIGTNYGISAPILKAYLGRPISISDMKNLSPKTASMIYKQNYWDKIKGDGLKNQSVALIIYDASVNHGLYATKSMVKKALSKQNISFTNFDSKVINKANQKTLFDDIYKERANRYASGNPAFREGWMRRLEEIKYAGGFTSKKAMFLALGVIVLGSMGYFIYKKPYELNIVGVRNKNTNPKKFDDTLYVFWKDDKNNWEGRKYAITTDPSTKYLTRGGIGSYQGNSATAILPSGQYIDTWKIGSHKGKYKALTQAKPICVYRDYDRNATLSFNLKDKDCGMFGINIHKAKSYGADDGNGNTEFIGDYSAGCQVFQNYYCFKEFMQLVEKQEGIYRNRYFTYTLFDKWTQNKLYIKRSIFIGGLIGGLGLLGYGLYLKGKKK